MSEEKMVLVVNSGSSSLKFGLFRTGAGGDEEIVVEGAANGIGKGDGTLVLKDKDGVETYREAVEFGTQVEALRAGLARLRGQGAGEPAAIGHRVVHGGPRLLEHQRITPEVIQTLGESVHFAPLHIPAALALIAEAGRAYPGVEQVACFDTTFHETMPEAAKRLPLPGRFWDAGVRRYGFHGLSYASVVHRLGKEVPGRVIAARIIAAHLGSGCSVAAIKDGCSVDTSMGLTPTGGVISATRTGDLDPGVLLYLMRAEGMDADALEAMLNHECGLAGLAEAGSDIRDVEKAADGGDARAAVALEVFYRTVAKTVAGYASVLGGVDLLVFTGGIGEHSERTRASICAELGFLGGLAMRVLASEEELEIARVCRGVMGAAVA